MLALNRLSICTLAALAGFTMACKGESKSVGTLPVTRRTAPLTPATRSVLEAAGAQCTPNPAGPVLCTWSHGGATCRLSFDSADRLTRLECDVDTLTWICTRPADLYVCTWSDDPMCGDVYGPNGVFEAYLCGVDLDNRIGRDGGPATVHDSGPQAGADAGPAPDVQFGPLDGGPAPGQDAAPGIPDAPPGPDAGHVSQDGGPAPCNGLDQAACHARADCRTDTCPTCDPSVSTFVTCSDPTAPPNGCPPVACTCAGLGEATCLQSTACHPVYDDPGTCGCAGIGCCARFSRCAENPIADCIGNGIACLVANVPHCEGDYVISYANLCYEGCVHTRECAVPPVNCAPSGGAPVSFPTLSTACSGPNDCSAAIHQIDCCGTRQALGLNSQEMSRFASAEHTCESQYPACDCANRGILADDGRSAGDPSLIGVTCQAGTCRTFVR